MCSSNACAQGGCNVGGEQSGHMILTDHATTGDGTVAALAGAGGAGALGQAASELLHQFDPVPQLLKQRALFRRQAAGGSCRVKAAIAEAEAALAGRGRLVIRPSGTEPVIRVMAEGDDAGSKSKAVVDAHLRRGAPKAAGREPD
jgi:phosphoglucosamine mutase